MLFDGVGVGASAGLVVLAVVAGVRGTRELARLEGWAPALGEEERTEAARRPPRVEGEALSML